MITRQLVTLMAPVLSFTAEEVWATLNPGRDVNRSERVFRALQPAVAGSG